MPNILHRNEIAPNPNFLDGSPHTNGSNQWFDHEFGGFTVPLTRQSGDRGPDLPEPSQAGRYTIKIVIQDVVDRRVDAAAFIKENSVKFVSVLPADFNLDGVVDVSDLNVWNANKFTNSHRFTQGDANGDGVVDISDLNIWNANKFQGGGYKYQPADFNDDGLVDDADCDILDANNPTPNCASRFDGDADGDVDDDDKLVWMSMAN